jgi:PAS domain S-box-containing protein
MERCGPQGAPSTAPLEYIQAEPAQRRTAARSLDDGTNVFAVTSESVGGSAASHRAQLWVVVVALAAIGGIVIADIAVGQKAVLAPAVVAAPFFVAVFDDGWTTLAVGFVAVAAAAVSVALQPVSTTQRLADIAIVVIGSALAAIVATARTRRDTELSATRPQADAARHLRLALDAGHMGTWSWNMGTNTVEWDDALASLFGLEQDMFEKTFEAWLERVHPDDRARALDTVNLAVKHGGQFRFDHRTIWPDGSVHWLEGRGEAVFDDAGEVVGAIGVAIDIDERRRADVERMALFTSERRARESAERSMAALSRLQDVTVGLSGATTVDEMARFILDRGIAALGAASGYFGTVDHEKQMLVCRAHVGLERELIDRYRFVDLSADLPAPSVLRSGESMFVESRDDGASRYPQLPRDNSHGAYVACPLIVSGLPIAAIQLGFDQPRRFDDEDRSFVSAVVEVCAQALERALLFEAERDSRERLRTLLDASERLAALDDPEAQLLVATQVAASIGRWGTVFLVQPDGTLTRAISSHAEPARQRLLDRVSERVLAHHVIQRVAETRQAVLLPEHFAGVADQLEQFGATVDDVEMVSELGWRSAALVPMIVGNRCVGVLAVGDDRPLPLGSTELELALDLGRRTASAYERARLLRLEQTRSARALQESEARVEAQHRVASLLQQSILPDELPAPDGVELAAAYQPGESGVDVGGDWYDAFTIPGNRLIIVIGDVAGHGVEAATLMGRVRNATRAYAVEHDNPARILARLDELMHALEPDAMVTAVAAELDIPRGTLSWSRAGHPPPLLLDGERVEYLEQSGGTPLGAIGSEYACETRHLHDGALLLLYTDGLVERRTRPIDDGLEWLAARARESREEDLSTLCALLVGERYDGQPSDDDVCVIALRVAANGTH